MPKTKQDILREFQETCLAGSMPSKEAQAFALGHLSACFDLMAAELVGAVPKRTKPDEDCSGVEYAFGVMAGGNSARSALLARCKELGLEVKV